MLGHRIMGDWGEQLAWLWHTLSGVAIVGAIVGILPPIAATIAIGWYLIQIYESRTVQIWLATRRSRKIAAARKMIERLEAQTRKIHAPKD